MKILNNVSGYEVTEANFEALRLALNYQGENYPVSWFHGIAGTAFRIGGICPCAPTCTLAMTPQELIRLFGYDYTEFPYDDENKYKDGGLGNMIKAVCESIDNGVPALAWHAFTNCEWDVVTGYDEDEKVFYGRGSYAGRAGDYAKKPWDRTLGKFASEGNMALTIKRSANGFDKRSAEIAAIKEAVRHANDEENVDKLGGDDWVFLQGKAAYKRWADDFSKPDYKKGMGDSYCIGIYSSCRAQAGLFLRGIAPDYPDASGLLTQAAQSFEKEAEILGQLSPLLDWSAPETDAERNKKAAALLREVAEAYGAGIDLLSEAVPVL